MAVEADGQETREAHTQAASTRVGRRLPYLKWRWPPALFLCHLSTVHIKADVIQLTLRLWRQRKRSKYHVIGPPTPTRPTRTKGEQRDSSSPWDFCSEWPRHQRWSLAVEKQSRTWTFDAQSVPSIAIPVPSNSFFSKVRKWSFQRDVDHYRTGLSLVVVVATTIAFWWFVEWRRRESFSYRLFHSLRSGFSLFQEEKERNRAMAHFTQLLFFGVWPFCTRGWFTLIFHIFCCCWRSFEILKMEEKIVPSRGLINTHVNGLSVDRNETVFSSWNRKRQRRKLGRTLPDSVLW